MPSMVSPLAKWWPTIMLELPLVMKRVPDGSVNPDSSIS